MRNPSNRTPRQYKIARNTKNTNGQSTKPQYQAQNKMRTMVVGRSAREAIRGERWRVAKALQSQKVNGDAM